MLLKSRLWASLPIRLYHRFYCRVETKKTPILRRVRYREIIVDNLSKAGWSWGCISAVDSLAGEQSSLLTHVATMESVLLCERMKKLTAFVELESATRTCGRLS
jgi:hypothetical protein